MMQQIWRSGVGRADLVVEVGPDRRVPPVHHQDRIVVEDLLADAGHPGRVHPLRRLLSDLVQGSPSGLLRGGELLQLRLALGQVGGGLALLELRDQHLQEGPGVADHGHVHRLVPSQRILVHVDLDQRLLVRRAPVGRLPPPVGLAEAGAQREHQVGLAAHLVVEVDVDHRDRGR
jgi:hypothetical protein